MASERTDESIAAYQECAQLLRPFMEAMPAAFTRLFNANLRDLIKALQANGATDAEVNAALSALGVQLEAGSSQPPEVVQFQAWAQAHNEGRGKDAQAAYADLRAALDAAPDDRGLDQIREALAGARAQLGEVWTYGELPKRG